MDTAQWTSEIVVKPMEEILPNNNTCTKPGLGERKVRPQKEQALNCPRCNSTNTKFCYYNNYSLSQPRYFCKTCRRYWTEGGNLRSIPVGGGSRKNKRPSSSSSPSSSVSSKKLQESSQNPKIHESQDLNLGFTDTTTTHDLKTISELITVPNFESNNNKNNMPCSSSTTSHLSAMELLTGFTSRGMNSFGPIPITEPNTVYSSGFSMPEFRPALNFSLDGIGIGSSTGYESSLRGVQETGGRFLFPFVDLKQVSTTTDTEENRDQQGDSTGYWNGMFGGGSW